MLHARKTLGAYYTPAETVAQALAALPDPPARARVVDLACGDGAWLVAAAARWPDSELAGVDVDPVAIARARTRLGDRASLMIGDGLEAGPSGVDLVVGNPPWGAGRAYKNRRGEESASRFVARALDVLRPGGRLCLLLPLAWLEVAAHRAARERLLARAALERVEPLGEIFRGVFAPCALVIARREPDRAARAAAEVWTPGGVVAQEALAASPDRALIARLDDRDRALVARLDDRAEHLAGRVKFILGVVTGCNREALGANGEPIVAGPDVTPLAIRTPSRRLCISLDRVQQAAPRAAYARPKVVYRFIAQRPIAAVDLDGRLTLNSANAFAVEDPALDPDFVAGVLNSAPLAFAHAARSGLPRILRSHLERLPLPRAAPSLRREISQLAQAGEQARIDEVVMDLFALDDDERARLRSAWPRS